MLRLLARSEVDTVAWDACVASSRQPIIYGYSWYLDAVTSGPAWRWVGLALTDETGSYRAVMPIPLRRKWGVWVVHQPLFCPFLDVFSSDETLDPAPFHEAAQQHYGYGSVLCLQSPLRSPPAFATIRPRTTHLLDLSMGYETLARRYNRDRRLNLRRAEGYGWSVTDSTDPEPLLALFRANHASRIEGGVGAWAYAILRQLILALQERGLASIQYAWFEDRVEAGALFVTEGNRIIYLFNAATETGRKGNARTLLIDRQLRANAGCRVANRPLLFDFESPQKKSIVNFYASFGATESEFTEVRWNRLPVGVKIGRRLLNLIRRAI
ncbi:GNAT family N-acetyltransferase [Spirosoma utsteinense]|uniref:BioF2-like acetyltransferase domain-containing protein n=1 Tax=Spirosoma utsteinense TaxID=2585773 RepID=A0ABR6W959_9BACT|nr:GNAT family N-acetyltransferase [Spirosoma utsteinense]MBC3793095.1 hypothetical protein [Spirosoma utsteinense]